MNKLEFIFIYISDHVLDWKFIFIEDVSFRKGGGYESIRTSSLNSKANSSFETDWNLLADSYSLKRQNKRWICQIILIGGKI